MNLNKNGRTYLVVIKRQEIVEEASKDKISISATDCRRLMLEAAELVKGLHYMGMRMACSIVNFIQIEHK